MSGPFAEGANCIRLPDQGCLTQSDLLRRMQSSTATLRDFSQELAIFSHAALLLLGNLPHDPLQQWLNEHPRSEILLGPLAFEFKVLDGFEPPLSHVLWFCEKDVWFDLNRMLSGLGGWDPGQRWLWLSQQQELEIVDPLALSRHATLPAVLPTVPVTLFGLDSSTADWHYVLENGRARLVQFAPRAATKDAATTFVPAP